MDDDDARRQRAAELVARFHLADAAVQHYDEQLRRLDARQREQDRQARARRLGRAARARPPAGRPRTK